MCLHQPIDCKCSLLSYVLTETSFLQSRSSIYLRLSDFIHWCSISRFFLIRLSHPYRITFLIKWVKMGSFAVTLTSHANRVFEWTCRIVARWRPIHKDPPRQSTASPPMAQPSPQLRPRSAPLPPPPQRTTRPWPPFRLPGNAYPGFLPERLSLRKRWRPTFDQICRAVAPGSLIWTTRPVLTFLMKGDKLCDFFNSFNPAGYVR